MRPKNRGCECKVPSINRYIFCINCHKSAITRVDLALAEPPQPQQQFQQLPQPDLFSLKCKFCGKVLSGTTSLKAHERSHMNEKPFPCRECGRTFVTNHHRIRHEKTLHGIEPAKKAESFQCPNCVRSFTSENFMIRHHANCVGT